MKTALNFESLLKKVLEENDFRKTSFFTNLPQKMSKDEFIQTQGQFYHAVVHFTRPLALCAAAVPTYEERVQIIKNLWEEHGEGNLKITHGETFKEFLRRLTKKEVQIPKVREAALQFNETLDEVCKSSHYLKSLAMMGIIERMFADISAFIGNTIVLRGWMEREEMIHYSLHQELDCVHAEDFFRILRPCFENEKEQKLIEDGLRLGAEAFNSLYLGLYESTRSP